MGEKTARPRWPSWHPWAISLAASPALACGFCALNRSLFCILVRHPCGGPDDVETSQLSSATIHEVAVSHVADGERVLRDAQTIKPAFASSGDKAAGQAGSMLDRVVYFRALRMGQVEVSLNYVAGADQDHLESMHLFPGVVQVQWQPVYTALCPLHGLVGALRCMTRVSAGCSGAEAAGVGCCRWLS